jgi:hypothetical protein
MILHDSFFLLLSFLILNIISVSAVMPSGAKPEDIVPTAVADWKVSEKDQKYKGKEIYQYIDGAGEVYLTFDFQEVLVRRYALQGEPDIIVELFRMSSPENAYGVFRHDCEHETAEVGQGCERRGGLLCFWKGAYYACVYAEGESDTANSAITSLAHGIADNITSTSDKPELLNLLPKIGLQENSVRYFYSPAILNYHYFIAEENILNLNKNTRCLLANYIIDGDPFLFFLAQYPSNAEAAQAEKSFISKYLHQTDKDGFKLLENNLWTGIARKEKMLYVVFDAPNRETAKSFLHSVCESNKE